ncbi:MAG: DUF1122 family protein [Aquificaceae bacterium]
MRERFENFILYLEKGITIDDKILILTDRRRGRFLEEENLTLELCGEKFLFLKVFYGRKPYWKEWVELFNVSPGFFSSPFEDDMYPLISNYFGRIFVEYYEDRYTLLQLEKGVPVEQTRLGQKLMVYGYVNLKNWYFTEGWMEGGYKIQGEK